MGCRDIILDYVEAKDYCLFNHGKKLALGSILYVLPNMIGYINDSLDSVEVMRFDKEVPIIVRAKYKGLIDKINDFLGL